MQSNSLTSKRSKRALILLVCAVLLGTLAWTGYGERSENRDFLRGRKAANSGLRPVNFVGGNAWQGAVPVPQSITLLEDTIVGGNKIHGVVRIFSRVSGENTVKLQTDNPNVLKAPGGSIWPYVLSIRQVLADL